MRTAGYCAIGLALVVMAEAARAAEEFPTRMITAQLRLFMEIDSNDDNRVSEREYVGDRGGKSRARVRRQFRSLDQNGDGWLSVKEYGRLADLRPGR
jgi:hypothetical protein